MLIINLKSKWWNAIPKRFPVLSNEGANKHPEFTNRYSQAMALAARGTVYVVVLQRNGEGGGIGAYQLPNKPSPPNVWRTYEFPAIQHKNAAVTSVKSVDASNDFAISEDWINGEGGEILPFVDANDLPSPTKLRRGSSLAVRDTTCEVAG